MQIENGFGIDFGLFISNHFIMKTIAYFFSFLFLGITLNSCIIQTEYMNGVSLEQVVTDNDIWYVDYNRTTGTGNVPFVSKAFTLSFINGRLYANNNIVGIGYTGNGYGIQKGTYNTQSGYLRINHNQDGFYEFEVFADSPTRIRLYNRSNNVTYYLTGYQKNYFDFDQVFYDNIEYFLQEYYAWNKTYTSVAGSLNVFDYENLLAFTPENNTTFYSSQDPPNTALNSIYWDYTGSYEVFDVAGYDNLKILSLYYSPSGYERFELKVLNDARIELYHIASGTTYRFDGRGFLQYKIGGKLEKSTEKTERQRTKISRETIQRETR